MRRTRALRAGSGVKQKEARPGQSRLRCHLAGEGAAHMGHRPCTGPDDLRIDRRENNRNGADHKHPFIYANALGMKADTG